MQNALPWFPCASDNTYDHGSHSQNGDDGAPTGCEFLRRLLSSPGIHNERRKKMTRKRDRDGFEKKSVDGGKKIERDSNARSSVSTKTDNMLSSVIQGYYQLFLPRQDADASGSNAGSDMHSSCIGDNDTSSNPLENKDATELINAERASSQLHHDLNAIILSRQRTNELYKASIEAANRSSENNTNQAPKGLQMNILIDEYMGHPNTAILRTYTSSLFDRYSSLEGESKHKFIRKMLGLTKENVKIQQVALLFLLEPLRRFYVKQLQDSISEQLVDLSNSNQEMMTKISLFPLVTQNVAWSDMSPEKIEEVSSHEPTQQILDFIMQSTHANQDSATSGVEKCWWSLPSPLICFISQLYFPFACGYIRYLIMKALAAHEKLYALGSHEIRHRSRPQSNLNSDSNINSFESAMLRIRHFSQTSQRLESLTAHILSLFEGEHQQTTEKHRNTSSDDEEHMATNDTIFRQKLAWNAIRKRLHRRRNESGI